MLKKKMKDEKDVGFTVIRVESSVSQLEEAGTDTEDDTLGDNDDMEEERAGVTPADTTEEAEEKEAETEMDTSTAQTEPR